MFRQALRSALVLTLLVNVVSAQASLERDRARSHYRKGWEFMRVEGWQDAAKEFQNAIDIDPQFEDAHYMLGRADMAMKKYAEAIASYTKARDLYRAQAGRQFSNQQEAQRYRQDRLTEIDEMIRQAQSGPQNLAAQERMRQLQEYRRQIQLSFQRGGNISIENSVPAFVSLALGSAYFRSGKLEDAEREYKTAVATDPKTGEAHSNLAVVYFETGRYDEAERAVAAAEKAGYKVHPQLKQDIREKKKGG
ncbi:MAG: tetratricopeptide repeat protein [Vicinamibacterales bacterium]